MAVGPGDNRPKSICKYGMIDSFGQFSELTGISTSSQGNQGGQRFGNIIWRCASWHRADWLHRPDRTYRGRSLRHWRGEGRGDFDGATRWRWSDWSSYWTGPLGATD